MTSPIAYPGTRVGPALDTSFWKHGVVGVRRLIGQYLGVNANSANTDHAIPLFLLPGCPASVYYKVRGVQVNNASIALSSATAGLFTAPAAGGTTLVTAAALSALTGGATDLDMTLAAGATGNNFNSVSTPTLYFRVGTAQGAAATCDVYIWGEILP